MTTIAFTDSTFEVDADIVADGLGITVPLLQDQMRSGKITTLSVRGVDNDAGRADAREGDEAAGAVDAERHGVVAFVRRYVR